MGEVAPKVTERASNSTQTRRGAPLVARFVGFMSDIIVHSLVNAAPNSTQTRRGAPAVARFVGFGLFATPHPSQPLKITGCDTFSRWRRQGVSLNRLCIHRYASNFGRLDASSDCQAKCNTFFKKSFGDKKPRHLRGRLLIKETTASNCSCVTLLKSVPLGKKKRTKPFMFSLLPRCQGA